MAKYKMLWTDLLREKRNLEKGEKILAGRKRQVMAMIEEIKRLRKECRTNL